MRCADELGKEVKKHAVAAAAAAAAAACILGSPCRSFGLIYVETHYYCVPWRRDVLRSVKTKSSMRVGMYICAWQFAPYWIFLFLGVCSSTLLTFR